MNIEISEEVFEWILKRIKDGESIESMIKLAKHMSELKNKTRAKK